MANNESDWLTRHSRKLLTSSYPVWVVGLTIVNILIFFILLVGGIIEGCKMLYSFIMGEFDWDTIAGYYSRDHYDEMKAFSREEHNQIGKAV